MGNIQDKSSFRGPSRAAGGGGCGGRLPLSNWQNTVAATTSHEDGALISSSLFSSGVRVT